MILVFVYGTLRQSKKATHTLKGYKLLDMGRFPGIVPDDSCEVHGNLVIVDREMLEQMDYMEGTKTGFYTRQRVTVGEYEAWVYVAGNVLERVPHPQVIPSGDWHDHPTKQKKVFVAWEEASR